MIIKNKYLLSLISEILNRLNKVKYFIKLNLKNIYHQIYILKMMSKRLYSAHYKYIIILFKLINASVTF